MWNTLSQIATAVGALIAASALFATFRIYQMTQRDQYVSALRTAMSATRVGIGRLNELVDYQLIHEMASSVIRSPDLHYPLEQMYNDYFTTMDEAGADSKEPDSSQNVAVYSKDDLKEYIESELRPITMPIASPSAEEYQRFLSTIESQLGQYQTDYPCLFRVLSSVKTYYAIILRNVKNTVRNDDAWERVILDYSYEQREDIHSVEGLKSNLIRAFVYLGISVVADQEEGNIPHYRTIYDLVLDRYQAMTEQQLISVSRTERNADLKPMSETATVTEDMRVAQEGLKHILSQDDLLAFSNAITRIEEQSQSKT